MGLNLMTKHFVMQYKWKHEICGTALPFDLRCYIPRLNHRSVVIMLLEFYHTHFQRTDEMFLTIIIMQNFG